ncbi:Tex family protein [Vampirovibrio chlorellavorus]|uniref:Tex family protein n=1 Tax=Vampirovibrio chlorellavorus TaxID=758823 RepID=UPI0026E9B705|nr:Tex family protein [Vampirovibrio chlorellavorus]
MNDALISRQIARELQVQERQVSAVLKLLEEGATIPFIARYRKEATGGLDDAQLRTLDERLQYLRDLSKRREAILESVAEQGKLTDELKQAFEAAQTKAQLEDLYLPFKPKRRTKAQMAREAGLAPLAERLFQNPNQEPEAAAKSFVNPEAGIPDVKAALEGASHILVEQFSESPPLIGALRELLWNSGVVISTVVKAKQAEAAKFSDYFDYVEPIRAIPSHRALALFRGKQEGFLRVALKPAAQKADVERATEQIVGRIARHFNWRPQNRLADDWLADCFQAAWSDKLLPHLESDLMAQLREQAEAEAIQVFTRNLRDLLLAAPAGHQVALGLDPGLRTGVKVAVVDATGKVLATSVIYPHPPQNQEQASIDALVALIRQHAVTLVSIGNGTGSRETDRLVSTLMKRHPELKLTKALVSEAGASVYSASALASQELPDMDVSLRGAVSIARRLQDPLAELVKIEPKAIGVGQYQHDVNQTRLERGLDAVVQDCVNAVGVDVNTASPALLRYVAGLSPSLAQSIVDYRNQKGAFANRAALKKVPRLGPKAFEQAAGFLRVTNGDNPLDASAVHPEAYPVVQKILKQSGRELRAVIGDKAFLSSLKPTEFTDDQFGLPTVRDILAELEKPGRDPRPAFQTAIFAEGVETLNDLKPGMQLEGVVTNVTNFGAFVDIGVHQDGLVHISMLADRFVKDPHSVVKAGDVVKVSVVEVDIPRKRIALSMRQSS